MLFSKKRIFLIVITLMMLGVAGVIWFVLSAQTFLAEDVTEKVNQAVEELGGYLINLNSLTGNPITGVNGDGVTFTHNGEAIASADRISLRLSLPSILSSSPKLAKMSIYSLKADYDTISKHLPEQKSSDKSAPPALDSLVLYDSSIVTPIGEVELDRLAVDIRPGSYGITLKGKLRDLPLLVMAKTIERDGVTNLEDFFCKWDGMSASAAGMLSPKMELSAGFDEVDTKKLTPILPFIEKTTVKGVYDGKLTIENGKYLSVKGSLSSKSGSIWKLPFKKLNTKIKYYNNTVLLDDFKGEVVGAAASGRVFVRIKPDEYPELSLKIKAEELKTGALVSEFSWMKNFPGVISHASCDLLGPVDSLSGVVDLKSPRIKITDFDCSSLSAKIMIKSMDRLSTKFNAGVLGALVNGSGDISLTRGVSLDMGLDVSALSLASVGKSYPDVAKAGISGDGKALLKVQGPVSSLVISGRTTFPALVLSGDYKLGATDGEFSYEGGNLMVKGLSTSWNGAAITASGRVTKAPASKTHLLDFEGGLSNAQLSSFAGEIEAVEKNRINGVLSGNWSISGSSKSPVVSFNIAAPQITSNRGISITALNISGRYSDGNIEISSVGAGVNSARLSGAGSISVPFDSKNGKYLFKGSFSDFRLSELKDAGIISEDIKGELRGDMRLWKDAGAPVAFRAYLKEAEVAYGKFNFSDIRGAVTLNGDKLELGNIGALMNYNNRFRINGSIGGINSQSSADITADKMPLDLTFSLAGADIGRMVRLFSPNVRGFQGQLACSADIKGTAANPLFTAAGKLSGVKMLGLSISSIVFENASGNKESMKFPKITAHVGSSGVVDAKAGIENGKSGWRGTVSAAGRSIDVNSLTFSLDDDTRKSIAGTLNFDFNGKGTADDFDGRGEVRMPRLTVMNLKFTNVKAPFHVSDGFALVEEATAGAYGGKAVGQVAKDLKLSGWGGRLIITSADCEPIFRDLMPDSEGRVKGKLKMKISLEGNSRRASTNAGSGSAEITNGEVTGFAGAAAVSKLTGGRPLRFASALASYSIDGNTFHLLPGSRVSAQRGDPAFKYVMVDGSITSEKQIDLKCVGNVNIRALNAFAGGVSGLLSAAIDGQEDMLSNFLGGALSGFSKNEFRDVSLRVVGTPDKIRFENVLVAAPAKTNPLPEKLIDDKDDEAAKDKIKINLEFPVGPGGGEISGDKGVGKQIGGQVLQQGLRGLIRF